jgi:predicted RNase H-like HicB family nuclease
MGITVKKKSNYAIIVWLDKTESGKWSGHIVDLDIVVHGDSPKEVLKEIGYEITRNEKSR